MTTIQTTTERFAGPLKWLLGAYVLFLAIQVDVGGENNVRLAPGDIALGLYLLMVATGFVRLRIIPAAWSAWHLAFAAVLILGNLIAVLSIGKLSTYALVNKDIGMITLFLSYMFFTAVAVDMERVRWILRLVVYGIVASNLLALAAFAANRLTGITIAALHSDSARLSGMAPDSNQYSSFLGMALIIVLVTSLGARPLVSRSYAVLAVMSLAMGIVLAYSRSGAIGVLLGLLVIAPFRPKVMGAVVAAAIAGVAAIVLVLGVNYLQTASALAQRPDQIQVRVHIIDTALPMFAESPIFGIGLGVFAERYVQNIIHNTPVWILTEFGLVGLAVFGGLFLTFVVRAWRVYRVGGPETQSVILALVAVHFQMLGVSMGVEAFYQRHWWLVMALIGSVYAFTMNPTEQGEPAVQPAEERLPANWEALG
ncbi:MAG TPA: O-antigen ligase family protein [Armatimonadota bacterium]|jgi:O-antigen ligase